MYFAINGGDAAFGADVILKDLHFEIRDKQKVAVVGRNGCGKSTLLRLISGEIELENVPDNGGISKSENTVIGYLKQISFEDENITFEEEVKKAFSNIFAIRDEMETLLKKIEENANDEDVLRYTALEEHFKLLGGYYYQKEYETVVKKFGFTKQDQLKKIGEFSGGQRTKIAFVKLLLSKPDILLLDEPTNHLDISTVEWLEEYIKAYPCAVVIVSHDQMFLDRTVEIVYEIEYGNIHKYYGNYSKFTVLKSQDAVRKQKEYERYKAEVARLEQLVDRFRYKATKAAMAQSKIKAINRMEVPEEVISSDNRGFYMDITPATESGEKVLEVKDLSVGYTTALATLSFTLLKGQRLGCIGDNGKGKSTLLKTLVGKVEKLGGIYNYGVNVQIGYFDQQLAQYVSEKTVLDDYWDEFPYLTHTQARNDLGAFLFRGEDVFKPVNVLSGGERVRLCLCKILKKRPNLLVLDEPTNHMDIIGKETLEEMLKGYTGTVICVSHDRYFIKEICDSLLCFENGNATYYPFGYSQYEQQRRVVKEEIKTESDNTAEVKKVKEKHFSPLKELSKVTKALSKKEESILLLEEEIDSLKNEISENSSDYEKLVLLTSELEIKENQLGCMYSEWEELSAKKEDLESRCPKKEH